MNTLGWWLSTISEGFCQVIQVLCALRRRNSLSSVVCDFAVYHSLKGAKFCMSYSLLIQQSCRKCISGIGERDLQHTRNGLFAVTWNWSCEAVMIQLKSLSHKNWKKFSLWKESSDKLPFGRYTTISYHPIECFRLVSVSRVSSHNPHYWDVVTSFCQSTIAIPSKSS